MNPKRYQTAIEIINDVIVPQVDTNTKDIKAIAKEVVSASNNFEKKVIEIYNTLEAKEEANESKLEDCKSGYMEYCDNLKSEIESITKKIEDKTITNAELTKTIDEISVRVEALENEENYEYDDQELKDSLAKLKEDFGVFKTHVLSAQSVIDDINSKNEVIEITSIKGLVQTLNEVANRGSNNVKISAPILEILSNGTSVMQGVSRINFGTGLTTTLVNGTINVTSSGGGGTPGGSDTQLQYNNAGSFGGITGATTNGTAVTYTANNLIAADVTASGSGGFLIQANNGTDVGLFGAGGGSNATFYGGVNIIGDLTVDTDVLDVDTTNNRVGILTTTPTHSLTFGSTSTGIALYNTVDQTTNYERALMQWSGNVFTISTGLGGTGGSRGITISTVGGGSMAIAGSTGLFTFSKSASSGVNLFTFSGTQSGSTGTVAITNIAPTINQSSTAGYTALLVNPTESTTGSGTKNLLDVQVGSASKFNVANTGIATHTNSVDAASNQVLILKGSRATPAISDEIYQSFFLNNGSGTSVEVARITSRETTITAGSEASELRFTVRASGSLPTNPHLFLNSARLSPFTNDGLALGATGTSWADLFLATGGVINWNNGNATLTHSTGLLTSNVPIASTQIYNADQAATVTTNAGTITRAFRNNTFTNSSAAGMTITLSTTGATAGDMLLVQIYDFSAVAQTITWVNTENSDVSAPTTSNGSTTLPRTAGFKWNPSTSKWRCMMNV